MHPPTAHRHSHSSFSQCALVGVCQHSVNVLDVTRCDRRCAQRTAATSRARVVRCIGTACIESPHRPAHQTGCGKGLRNRFHHAKCAAAGASSQATRGTSRGLSARGQDARVQTCGARLTRTSRYGGHAGKECRRLLRRTRAREKSSVGIGRGYACGKMYYRRSDAPSTPRAI